MLCLSIHPRVYLASLISENGIPSSLGISSVLSNNYLISSQGSSLNAGSFREINKAKNYLKFSISCLKTRLTSLVSSSFAQELAVLESFSILTTMSSIFISWKWTSCHFSYIYCHSFLDIQSFSIS